VALAELTQKEYICLELMDKAPLCFLSDVTDDIGDVNLDDAASISKIFLCVIDFRSHITATHSAGVAKTAQKLGELAGLSTNECKMLLIAGYLHDLGKLAIGNSVLEKPTRLDPKEYSMMRSHPFYTYRLLSTIKGFETINQWASFHHERMNGSGYPFHLKGEDMPLGSRILAVADIFNAITEHRPYRADMEKSEICHILKTMSDNNSICPKVVAMLFQHFNQLNSICHAAQQTAAQEYEEFFADENSKVLTGGAKTLWSSLNTDLPNSSILKSGTTSLEQLLNELE